MAFVKRDVADNLVVLGDDDGNVRKAGGILVRFVPNTQFDKPKTDYEFVNKKGELMILSGSATLSRQIGSSDLGKFFKAEFEGWGKSANGKFKKIGVYFWDGDPTEEMKQWPKFSQYFGAATSRNDFADMPKSIAKGQEEDDDDLPF